MKQMVLVIYFYPNNPDGHSTNAYAPENRYLHFNGQGNYVSGAGCEGCRASCVGKSLSELQR